MGRLQKMHFSSPQKGYEATSESPAISVAPTMTCGMEAGEKAWHSKVDAESKEKQIVLVV